MKKLLSLLFVTLIGATLILSSCEDDDDPNPSGPVSVTGFETSEGFTDEGRIYTRVGATVTLIGEGFSQNTADNVVTIGGVAATVTEATETSIKVTVPDLNPLELFYFEVTVDGEKFEGEVPVKVFPENTVFVTDDDIESATWTKDKVYVIDGYIFVEGDLTIEAGTVVMGITQPFASDNASSLIITTSGTIDAEGTVNDPIIFTSESDMEAIGGTPNLDGTDTKGWAGLIILGEAGLGAESSQVQIEGIPDGEDRALYGGDNDQDNSGTLKYVSIRFSGAEIGPGDEIQGLTLGGVGSGTTIDYVDVFSSSDDGIEIFGGSVVIKHFSVAFAEDDSYDFDLGWTGYGQYLFALQRSDDADHGGEWDGAKPDDNSRYTNARIYNATFIGRGKDETTEDEKGSQAIVMRDGNAISLYNSIIGDFGRRAIQVEDRGESSDSYDKLTNEGVNEIGGNIWFELEGNTFDASDQEGSLVVATSPGDDDTFVPSDATAVEVASHLSAKGNIYMDEIAGITPNRNQGANGLSVVPTAAEVKEDIFVPTVEAAAGDSQDDVSYKGAFEPGQTAWIAGWTTLARFGYLAE